MLLYVHFLLTLFVYGIFTAKSYPKVNFPKGTVTGYYIYTRGGRMIEAFLGLPYAQPPVGDLRFQPPQPADLIIGDMLAQTPTHPCTQLTYTAPDSEDCLHLNVYTPDSQAVHPVPVYLFVHGGGNIQGSAYTESPEYLLDEDIILVTLDYRIGLLGFISTGDSVVPGNMALKDIRCALRWIHDNIWRFGGDPKKVTIGGHSAGGSFVHDLMIYSGHEGIFRSGICQSGTANSFSNFVPPLQVRWIKDNVANITQCPTESVAFIRCLKAKPAKYFVELYNKLTDKHNEHNPLRGFTGAAYGIVGAVLEPACVKDRIITGNPWNYNISLPFLTGVTSKESLYGFYTKLDGHTPLNYALFDAGFNLGVPISLNYQFSFVNGSQVPFAIRDFYLKDEPFSRDNLPEMTDALTDAIFGYPSFDAATTSESPNIYYYLFDHIGPRSGFNIPPEDRFGAVHTDELQFLFPSAYPFIRNTTAADIQLSKTLVKFWVNFIKYSDPSPDSIKGVKWTPFRPRNSYLYIKRNGMQTMQDDLFSKRMEFWRSQPYPFRDEDYGEVPCHATTK